jgi:hypothetical protein
LHSFFFSSSDFVTDDDAGKSFSPPTAGAVALADDNTVSKNKF